MRLEGYDYSLEGAYFITVCTLNRELLFSFEPAANMVEKYWNKISEKYPTTELDEYIIMPNHIHGILRIVGADPCVGPSPKDLPQTIQWFKTMTTNAYLAGIKREGWPPFNKKLWQRGYYERIIRSEKELNIFRQYIKDNPAEWEEDEENPFKMQGPTHGSAPTIR